MQESVYKQRVKPRRLADDAPNILIVLIDDGGSGQPSTFGGEINTPTMDRIVDDGIAYNRFHTTALCSPTRASLLTGRNHHRVWFGIITEFANDWEGYTGGFPRAAHSWQTSSRTTATPRVRGASGITRRPRRPGRPARLKTGPRVWGSSTSMDFLERKPPTMSQLSFETWTTWRRRRLRRRATI